MADETKTAADAATVEKNKTSDQRAAENKDVEASPTPKTKDSKPASKAVSKPTSNARGQAKTASGKKTSGTNTAALDDGKGANHQQTEISASSDRVGDTGPERGGVQAIEYERAAAEKEERDAMIEYKPAVYKDAKNAHLLREVASELGLTRPIDYAELARLNGGDLNARFDAGEEIRLPQQYEYKDVENVTGGGVKK